MAEALTPTPSRRPWVGRLRSDERLVGRAVQGDQRAFAAIFERYHQDLYRYCQAILGNPQDAQDALQDTMVKALGALPGQERAIQLKPWLYRIAHNEAIELVRRRRPTEPIDSESQPALQAGPEQAVEAEAGLRQLIADLNELPERQRGALVMRELSGLRFEEIGAALGTTPAAARQAIYEARSALGQMASGREMSCERVTRALSDGDRRILRGREVRAHLRACARCRAFKDAIATRRRELAALGPLPLAASAGLLGSLLGTGQGGSGLGAAGGLASTLGAGAGKTLATSAALKSTAAVVAVAAVGAGAAEVGGLTHLTGPGQGSDAPARSSPPAVGLPAHRSAAPVPTGGGPTRASARRDAKRAAIGPARSERAADGYPSAAKGKPPRGPGRGPASHGARGDAPSSLPAAAAHGQPAAAARQPARPPAGAQGHPGPNSRPGAPIKPPTPPTPPPDPPARAPAPSPPPAASATPRPAMSVEKHR